MRNGNYITRLLHAVNKDNPDCKMEFYSGFPDFIAFSDEINFKFKCIAFYVPEE
jgi:hypothetical protein